MATLNPTLKLISADTASDALAFTVTDALSVTQPMVDIAQVNLGTGITKLVPITASAITYFYCKNNSTTETVVIQQTAAAQDFADLSPGEFMIYPVKGLKGVNARSAANTAVLEYGYWTKA